MDIQHSDIWIAGQYLLLLMQFLENKVALELTRSDYIEAQEVKMGKYACHICISIMIFFGVNWISLPV